MLSEFSRLFIALKGWWARTLGGGGCQDTALAWHPLSRMDPEVHWVPLRPADTHLART